MSPLLAALALASLPARAARQGFDHERLHEQAVIAERARLLLDAWLLAGEAARASAQRELERLTPAGAPSSAPLSARAMTGAWRALGNRQPASEAGELQELADALDLRVTPGFFASRAEGPGEVTTVRLRLLWDAPVSHGLMVSLVWLPPSEGAAGAEPVRARREPASARAFEGAGFEMYIRPPVSAPGMWRLVAELEQGERRARGVPVPVECLAAAPELIALAREALADEQRLFVPIAQGLLASALSGARLPAGLEPSLCRQILRDPLRGDQRAQPRPVEVAFQTSTGEERWIWSWFPPQPARIAIVILVPDAEPPEALFAGVMGERWVRVGTELRAPLFASHLPPRGANGRDARAVLERLAELAELAGSRLPLALVARNHTLGDLAIALAGVGQPPFDALLAAWSIRGEPRAPFGGLPSLFVARDGPPQPQRTATGVLWVAGERFALLAEPLLVDQARAWLAQVLEPGAPREDGERR